MDRRATVLSIAIPPLMLACFVLGFLLGQPKPPSPGADPSAKVREVAQRIGERYYGEVKGEDLERGAVDGMLATLDPNCQYFSVADWKEFNETTMEGKFGGVGIFVEEDAATGYIRIQTPIEDTPAFAADVLPGDLIVKVDGADIKELPLNEVVRRMRGPVGSTVVLTLAREKRKPFEVSLVRAEIVVKAVKSKMLEGGIGYVRVSDFTKMLDQFDAAVAALEEQGMKALVVDLRFNGGGLLKASVELSDRFLPAGKVVVRTKGKMAEDIREQLTQDDKHDVGEIPVAVLINDGSASASEIFAGALRDHGRAKLVGSRSYGKGSVQTPFPLTDGSHVKLTTARYFTPSGVSVHREPGKRDYGLDPDYLVEMSAEEYNAVRRQWSEERVIKRNGETPTTAKEAVDYQLKAAVEVVSAALAKREPAVERRELSAIKKKDETPK